MSSHAKKITKLIDDLILVRVGWAHNRVWGDESRAEQLRLDTEKVKALLENEIRLSQQDTRSTQKRKQGSRKNATPEDS